MNILQCVNRRQRNDAMGHSRLKRPRPTFVLVRFAPIVLQNYFELPSEEIFFKIAHRCGILIQETARSDSILARFRLIHGCGRVLQHNPPKATVCRETAMCR